MNICPVSAEPAQTTAQHPFYPPPHAPSACQPGTCFKAHIFNSVAGSRQIGLENPSNKALFFPSFFSSKIGSRLTVLAAVIERFPFGRRRGRSQDSLSLDSPVIGGGGASKFYLQLNPHFSNSKCLELRLKHFFLTITHHLVVRTSENGRVSQPLLHFNKQLFLFTLAFVGSISAKHFKIVHRGKTTATGMQKGARNSVRHTRGHAH